MDDLPGARPQQQVEPAGGAGAVSSHDFARPFDYTLIATELADEMRAAADRVHTLQRAAVIEVGRELTAIKQQIKHGHFVEWVTRECGMLIRGAQFAMQAAEMVAKNEKLSYLPPDGLRALGSRAARPVADEIIVRIDAGERPSAAEIKRQIATATREAEEAKLNLRQRKARARRRADDERRRQRSADDEAAGEARANADAETVAAVLRECLGDRLIEVMSLIDRTEWWCVRRVLRREADQIAGGGETATAAVPSPAAEHLRLASDPTHPT